MAFHIILSGNQLCGLCPVIGQGGLEICSNGDWPHLPLDVHHRVPAGDSWPLLTSLALRDDLGTCHGLTDNDIRSQSNAQPVQPGQGMPLRQLHFKRGEQSFFVLLALASVVAFNELKKNFNYLTLQTFSVWRIFGCNVSDIMSVGQSISVHSGITLGHIQLL